MRKINKLFFLILLLLPAVAYTADMPCSYKTSGKNIITVCKDSGRTYYNSLAAVLSEFANNSGISAGQKYYLQPTEDKTGSNQQIADYVSRYIAAHLIHEGIGILKEKAEDTGEIGCSFDISGDILKISFDAGKKQDRSYSETFNIRNASAIKEEAALYSVQCGECPECINCPKCPECPQCGPRISLTDEIAKFFPNKPLYFIFGGLLIILLGIILAAVFKPVYPVHRKTIWSIIFMFIAGLAVFAGGLFGLALPSWSWPLDAMASIIVTLFIVLAVIFMRNTGLFRRP